jgi:hypothetical protein
MASGFAIRLAAMRRRQWRRADNPWPLTRAVLADQEADPHGERSARTPEGLYVEAVAADLAAGIYLDPERVLSQARILASWARRYG